jgi:hypothetical protein
MRRIAVLLFVLWLPTCLGCGFFRDLVFGTLAEKGDTSRLPSERRAAYDGYIQNNVEQ